MCLQVHGDELEKSINISTHCVALLFLRLTFPCGPLILNFSLTRLSEINLRIGACKLCRCMYLFKYNHVITFSFLQSY